MLTEFNWVQATGSSPIFIVLIGCSIVTLAIALERAWYFWKRSGNPDETLEKTIKKVRSGQVEEAIWTCESSLHPMGKVAAAIFRTGRRKGESYEEKMQIELSQQKLLFERNLGTLGTMAAIAPLIGLLGTVWGIMRAFHDMAATGSAAPTVVAAGVAEALITTAAGLIVAVPALVLYNHFSGRLNVMLTVAENHTRTVRDVLMNDVGSDDRRSGSGGESAADPGNEKKADGTPAGTPEPAATR
jgi:biopolymer transport protein ExbB